MIIIMMIIIILVQDKLRGADEAPGGAARVLAAGGRVPLQERRRLDHADAAGVLAGQGPGGTTCLTLLV